MPIHDWTRVTAGTWHDFHLAWLAEIRRALNGGRLPAGYYAQTEQVAGPMGPDVLTLREDDPNGPRPGGGVAGETGGTAVAVAPPATRIIDRIELDHTTRRRRTMTIRHTSDDRVVALIEVVSPGNKAAWAPFEAFVRKVADALTRGIHVVVVDLFPPTRRDRDGIHAAIVAETCPGGATTAFPADVPLTLASYVAGSPLQAYVEPTAVGRVLIDMPLFLSPERYVNLPLEATYLAAFEGEPEKYKRILS